MLLFFQFVGAVSLAFGALNAWQNLRIELKIAELRKDLVEEKLVPLQVRVTALEVRASLSEFLAAKAG